MNLLSVAQETERDKTALLPGALSPTLWSLFDSGGEGGEGRGIESPLFLPLLNSWSQRTGPRSLPPSLYSVSAAGIYYGGGGGEVDIAG
jgi:hypothetical protein